MVVACRRIIQGSVGFSCCWKLPDNCAANRRPKSRTPNWQWRWAMAANSAHATPLPSPSWPLTKARHRHLLRRHQAMAAPRPQPRFPEPDTQPFWEATKRHELTYQTCNACQEVIFYPRRHCTACGSLDTTWHVSKGEGTVYTFSVVGQSR